MSRKSRRVGVSTQVGRQVLALNGMEKLLSDSGVYIRIRLSVGHYGVQLLTTFKGNIGGALPLRMRLVFEAFFSAGPLELLVIRGCF